MPTARQRSAAAIIRRKIRTPLFIAVIRVLRNPIFKLYTNFAAHEIRWLFQHRRHKRAASRKINALRSSHLHLPTIPLNGRKKMSEEEMIIIARRSKSRVEYFEKLAERFDLEGDSRMARLMREEAEL